MKSKLSLILSLCFIVILFNACNKTTQTNASLISGTWHIQSERDQTYGSSASVIKDTILNYAGQSKMLVLNTNGSWNTSDASGILNTGTTYNYSNNKLSLTDASNSTTLFNVLSLDASNLSIQDTKKDTISSMPFQYIIHTYNLTK